MKNATGNAAYKTCYYDNKPSSVDLVKLTRRAVIPFKHPATTVSFGSFVNEVI